MDKYGPIENIDIDKPVSSRVTKAIAGEPETDKDRISTEVQEYLAGGGTITHVEPKKRRQRTSKSKIGHWERAKVNRAMQVDRGTSRPTYVDHTVRQGKVRCGTPGEARQLAARLTDAGNTVEVRGTMVRVKKAAKGSVQRAKGALRSLTAREAEQELRDELGKEK